MFLANQGIEDMEKSVDTLLVIPNQNLSAFSESMTLLEAFEKVDGVLGQSIRALIGPMMCSGLINIDFADFRSVIENVVGKAMIGVGEFSQSDGEDRAVRAAEISLLSPLLDIRDKDFYCREFTDTHYWSF